MTAEGWIHIVFDLSLLMALVFAVLTALVVPNRICAARLSQAKQTFASAAERLGGRWANR
jgi:hypothetical protein